MVWCRLELLAVLVAASSVVPGASGCAGQGSAGTASPHWIVPPVLPPGASHCGRQRRSHPPRPIHSPGFHAERVPDPAAQPSQL